MKTDPNKKKTTVLVSLLLVMLAVGAFSFLGGSSAPAQEAGKTAAAKKERLEAKKLAREADSKKDTEDALPSDIQRMVSMSLPARDPFKQLIKTKPDKVTNKSKNMPSTGPVDSSATVTKPTPIRNGRPVPPLSPLQGELPEVDGASPKPVQTSESTGQVGKNNGMKIRSGTPVRNEGDFAYSLVGVVDGPNPAAVLLADSGEQRVVKAGTILDGKSRIIKIQRGRVVVDHSGKILTLKVGGTRG